MAGRFRIAIKANKMPEIIGILRSRSDESKHDIADVATRGAAIYEKALKKAAPKAPAGKHLLQKGITVTPVQATGTRWHMIPESKAPYTKFVIKGTTGPILPKRSKFLTVYYTGARGRGAPMYRAKAVRGQEANPFQITPGAEATLFLEREMTILGHKLTSITVK